MLRRSRFPKAFLTDENGGVAVMFGLVLLGVLFAAGMAVDYGRVVHTKTRLAQAVDAAALAAGRALLDGRLSNSDVEEIATRYFDTNLGERSGFGTVGRPVIQIVRETGEVHVTADANVPMTLTKIAGFTNVNVPATASSRFDDRDIELSMGLDITGSMGGSKIAALKSATNALIDIMLPDPGGDTENEVRVALAPYSSGVNAGDYVQAATGQKKQSCTFEREGSSPTGDQSPGPNNYLKVQGDDGIAKRPTCPSAKVIPLTKDKALLKREVSRYSANGATAGHLGALWGYFLLSPNWGGVFGGDSVPVAYGDRKTVKAMVFMTDGEFNTIGGTQSWRNTKESQDTAVEICRNMRSNSILVYTVAFQLNSTSTKQMLLDCAGSPDRYFDASDDEALRTAFTRIATQLNNLRLTN
ncbi:MULTISPECIES: TadE/TadG family type IV pilus assembly protein [Filomicrobium]|uniref:Flp pilus assembly protein TadG n=1 Tax=Filomicrobium insigne TaxID=418854 RepID=A0A1H0IYQ2_9HYPH|nr:MULTISPECIES: TadE/TadG family type IV pilus assembly protein [Filomicrobium]MCV0368380.1 pilus assembly protein [Filomicrobium sp.]SDO36594.1 Flp pilus assembly protein TadG [Filomicrobium insigne]